jgi:tungstate transport system ATP-binding protein
MIELHLNNLYFSYDNRVLINHTDLNITSAGITCITGSNGSGKSTLLKLMHGLIQPTSGTIQWISNVLQPTIGMVFQRPLMLRRTVLANIQFAINIQKTQQDPFKYLHLLDLTHLAHKPARSLSGGEQQKLEMARVLAQNPDILLLDEPTAHLDSAATERIEQLLLELSTQGKKIFCASHNLNQVKRIATDTLHLEKENLCYVL